MRGHRRARRREQDIAAQRHLHLGGVAVGEQAISGEILVDRVEMRFLLERLAGARHARRRIDDERSGLDEVDEWLQREDRRGWVAARRRDRPRRGDVGAVQLGNAVDEAAEQLGRAVRLIVPALISRRVIEPEIGARSTTGFARDDLAAPLRLPAAAPRIQCRCGRAIGRGLDLESRVSEREMRITAARAARPGCRRSFAGPAPVLGRRRSSGPD